MAQLFAQPFYTAISAAGNVLSGAKLYFYATGTTTPQTTYQDDGLATPHTNPVVADSAGRFPAIFLNMTLVYRVKLTESNDALVKDVDPVNKDGLTTFTRELLTGTDAGDVLDDLGVSAFVQTLLPLTTQTLVRSALGVIEPAESMILNGEVLFDQVNEGGQYTSNATEKYGPDQWRFAGVGTGSWNFRRTSSIFPGFAKALQATIVTPQASISASDNHHIEHAIEGYRIRKLKWGTAAAVPLTLQFWINTTVPGDYSLAVLNGTNTVFYLTTFNVASTGNHQIAVTIPACTIGTWVDTSLFGLKFIWDLGWGSSFESGVTGAWTVGSGFRKPGTVALIQNSGAVMYLGGFQDDIGTSALPFRYRQFDQQLLDLQRYFWKSFDQGVACANGAGSFSAGELVYAAQIASTTAGYIVPVRNPVVMTDFTRTILTYNPVSANAKWRNEALGADSGTPTIFAAGASGFNILNPQVVGDTVGSSLGIHFSVNARMGGF